MEVSIALDTNAYAAMVRGDSDLMAAVQQAAHVYLPIIVIGELRAGFLNGRQQIENERLLKRFLGNTRVSVLPIDDETTVQYSHLKVQLTRQGTPIPANDIWIAALVLQHGLTLCTSDAHFQKIPHLTIW